MLLKAELPLLPEYNFEDVHDKLGLLGAEALLKTIEKMKSGDLSPEAQDDSLSNYAAKIEKSDCLIDFTKDATRVHDLIRGLSPIPLSFTHTPDGKLLKVVKSEVVDPECENKAQAGEVVEADEAITVACGRGKINLLTVIPEGKKRMNSSDFIRGRKINVGDVLK